MTMMLVWVQCLFIVCRYGVSAAPAHCDASHGWAPEGNLGQTGAFPWLGLLRVHLHEGTSFRVALTGVVLIKPEYAIVNADDVDRVPKNILTEDSDVMFTLSSNDTWNFGVRGYVTHHDFQYSTINALAVLELDAGEDGKYPIKPICWPVRPYNVTNEIYAISYNDENEELEKSIYKMKYVGLEYCKEFHHYTKLSDGLKEPTEYLCAVAVARADQCVWDNGMVLASNMSGYWALVGFGVRGLGCAAPTRFLPLLPLLPWLDAASHHPQSRRAGDVLEPASEEVPIHELFGDTRRGASAKHTMPPYPYPFNTESVETKYFTVLKLGDKSVAVMANHVKKRSCEGTPDIYRDEMKLVSPGRVGASTYKLSLYDLNYLNYSCVTIKIGGEYNSSSSIYFSVSLDQMEDTAIGDFGDTPEVFLKRFPLPRKRPIQDWRPGPNLGPHFLDSGFFPIDIPNINVYIKLHYKDAVKFIVSVFGPDSAREYERSGDEGDSQLKEKIEEADIQSETDAAWRLKISYVVIASCVVTVCNLNYILQLWTGVWIRYPLSSNVGSP